MSKGGTMSDAPKKPIEEIVDGVAYPIEQTDNGPKPGDELVPDAEVWTVPESEDDPS